MVDTDMARGPLTPMPTTAMEDMALAMEDTEQHPYQYPVTHLQTNHRTMDDKELSPRARVTIDEA